VFRAVLLAALALLVTAARGENLHGPLRPAATTDRQTRTVSLPEGRALSVELTIGQVRIVGSPDTEAAIEIDREAPSPEGLLKIPIELVEDDKRVRVRTVQIEGGTDPAFRTNITARVPHGAAISDVRIMEGSLTLRGLSGSITADLRRGPIDASDLAGVVRLETGIGHVRATRMTLSPGGLLRLRAFNGDVRLALAARPADARIMALALNGSITSAIPLTMKDTWGPRWGEATIGKGEAVISLDVVTGRIEITAPEGN
jgi:hypothetical protein